MADVQGFKGTQMGAVLWEPSEERRANSNLARYSSWLANQRGLRFEGYDELWKWSVSDLEGFWSSIWDYFEVISHAPSERALSNRSMPGTEWFPGAALNYAEHALRRRDNHLAVIARSETRPDRFLTYEELGDLVGAAREGLRRLGVSRGDRVVAFAPNLPETLVAFLATASLGAIWSSCAPEFGSRAVVDRFRQIEPKVLVGVDGYRYAGQDHNRLATLKEVRDQIPGLEAVVLVPYLEATPHLAGLGDVVLWEELTSSEMAPVFEPVPFDEPLWIVYSSGTTGPPKGIVHGHGGVLLEAQKELALHSDLGPNDRFFWFTTTGWVMWNYLVSHLLLGGTVLMYDGSPAHPDLMTLWRFAEEAGTTYFGISAGFIQALMKDGAEPGRDHNLGALHSLGSTGSPLPPEAFQWVYQHVKKDLLLASISGGTDVATAFLTSCPILPVRAGELQCRALGAKVEAYDQDGSPVTGEVGELVITEPMPSMPVRFWNDPGGQRYKESYFDTFPGVWRHGDWIEITPRGSAIIYGRSDATLNRDGLRMGTAEFYRVIEDLPEVVDSLVVDTGGLGEPGQIYLFLVVAEGQELTDELVGRVRSICRQELSPRHVPDHVRSIPEVPRTLSGKKLELPIKRILMGSDPDEAARREALANPDSLDYFSNLS